jgi:hypothetical protein
MRASQLTRVFAVAVFFCSIGMYVADGTAVESKVVDDYIIVGARNVDDRVDIYVGGENVGSCTWTSNPGCSVRVKIPTKGAAKLKIRFKLTNYVYNGTCILGPCGKYAGDFYVRNSNGETEWSDSVNCHVKSCSGGNSRGVKYDHTVTWERD